MKSQLLTFFTIPFSILWGQVDWQEYKVQSLSKMNNFSSWSAPQKAALIMDYIYATKPGLCVEIGSFQGSISFAIANALSYNQRGMLHTIDTWQYIPDESKKSDYNQFANYWYSLSTDGDLVYLDFLARHFQGNLRNHIHPLRVDSLKAVTLFPDHSIDMLYLDGDFSENHALSELTVYYPKVKKGGGIWLNRADLESKHTAVEFLMERCQYEKLWSYGIECVLFTKK
jgi:Methyltransferase domain